MIELSDLLGKIHLHVPLKILDETSNDIIEETKDYDGFSDYGKFIITGVTIMFNGTLLIIVKPLY